MGRNAFLQTNGFGKAQNFFLLVDGIAYDSKAIVGVAHKYEVGAPLLSDDFSGGETTVATHLIELGFQVVRRDAVAQLPRGAILKNDALMMLFDVGLMGGMRRSVRRGHLVVVSDHTKSIYEDRWEGDVLHYTGMGKIGDQELVDQNRTLAESSQSGVDVYLFEVFEPGKYVFHGKAMVAATPYREIQPDKEQRLRNVWMFPLRLTDTAYQPRPAISDIHRIRKLRERALRTLSLEQLRRLAGTSSPKPAARVAVGVQIIRNEAVATYVKAAANGSCDLCQSCAPFNDGAGQPFLECHHVNHLAKGGADTKENAVALCPNCHRKMHSLDLASDREILRSAIKRREAEAALLES